MQYNSARTVLDGKFYGQKLHLIYNEIGELLNFIVTTGNVDDRTPEEQDFR